MFCSQCGTEIQANQRFCGRCGATIKVIDPSVSLKAEQAAKNGQAANNQKMGTPNQGMAQPQAGGVNQKSVKSQNGLESGSVQSSNGANIPVNNQLDDEMGMGKTVMLPRTAREQGMNPADVQAAVSGQKLHSQESVHLQQELNIPMEDDDEDLEKTVLLPREKLIQNGMNMDAFTQPRKQESAPAQSAKAQGTAQQQNAGAPNVNPQSVNMQKGNVQPANPQPVNMQKGNVQPSNPQPVNMQKGNVQPSNPQPVNMQKANVQPSNPQPVNMQKGNVQPSNPQPVNMQKGNVQPTNQQNMNIQNMNAQSANQQNMNTQRTSVQSVASQSTNGSSDNKIILQIFSGVFAAIFVVYFFMNFFGGLGELLDVFDTISYLGALGVITSLVGALLHAVQGILFLLSAVVLVLCVLRWQNKNSDTLFIGIAECGLLSLVMIVVRFLVLAINMIQYSFWITPKGYVTVIILYVVAIAGMYGILYLMGEQPLRGLNKDMLKDVVMAAPKEIIVMIQEFVGSVSNKSQTQNVYGDGVSGGMNAYNGTPAQGGMPEQTAYGQNVTQGASEKPIYGQSTVQGVTSEPDARDKQDYDYTQGMGYGQHLRPAPAQGRRLKTNRSLLLYILLSLVTCGIYSWVFFYQWAQDVNTACAGDGEETPGLLKFILLSFVTCGIYAYVWYYKLANRLQANGPRYGRVITENGTSVLLWMLIGWMLCGIGTFVGLHIIIKNTNLICAEYNRVHSY